MMCVVFKEYSDSQIVEIVMNKKRYLAIFIKIFVFAFLSASGITAFGKSEVTGSVIAESKIALRIPQITLNSVPIRHLDLQGWKILFNDELTESHGKYGKEITHLQWGQCASIFLKRGILSNLILRPDSCPDISFELFDGQLELNKPQSYFDSVISKLIPREKLVGLGDRDVNTKTFEFHGSANNRFRVIMTYRQGRLFELKIKNGEANVK